jgi:class 3 adenylate cyclase
MTELINLFNQEQALLNRVQIQIGFGSRTVVAGYVGTQPWATYTCVWDTVNLAARQEAHTKVIGEPILIEENTLPDLDDAIPIAPQGKLQFKGKTRR